MNRWGLAFIIHLLIAGLVIAVLAPAAIAEINFAGDSVADLEKVCTGGAINGEFTKSKDGKFAMCHYGDGGTITCHDDDPKGDRCRHKPPPAIQLPERWFLRLFIAALKNPLEFTVTVAPDDTEPHSGLRAEIKGTGAEITKFRFEMSVEDLEAVCSTVADGALFLVSNDGARGACVRGTTTVVCNDETRKRRNCAIDRQNNARGRRLLRLVRQALTDRLATIAPDGAGGSGTPPTTKELGTTTTSTSTTSSTTMTTLSFL